MLTVSAISYIDFSCNFSYPSLTGHCHAQVRKKEIYKLQNLSREQISILNYLAQNSCITTSEAFQIFSDTSDYSLKQLMQHGYICSSPLPPDNSGWYFLTPKGKTFINDHIFFLKEKEVEIKQLRKDALFSKVLSVLALIVSIVSVVIQILR